MSRASPRVSKKSWMAIFKGVDHVLKILEIGQRLPCGIMKRVALPLHEILHTRVMVSLVEDGLHFILGLTIDDEGRWEVERTTRKVEARGVGVREKPAHMEDIMSLHVGGGGVQGYKWGGRESQ